MSASTSLALYTLSRSVVRHSVPFSEPAFELLGNPAPLYGALLRHLGKYGATLRSLSIDTRVLAEARVLCVASPNLSASVTVSGLEVTAELGSVDLVQAIAFARAFREAVSSVAPNATYTSQSVSNALWGTIGGTPFAKFAGRLAQVPSDSAFDGLSLHALAWSDSIDSTHFRIEESQDRPGDLFVHSLATFAPDVDLDSIASAFKKQLLGRLEAVGLTSNQFS